MVHSQMEHRAHNSSIFPTLPPGYTIVETPQNVLCFPVNVKTINFVTVKIVNKNGEIINFREETKCLRLHLSINIVILYNINPLKRSYIKNGKQKFLLSYNAVNKRTTLKNKLLSKEKIWIF